MARIMAWIQSRMAHDERGQGTIEYVLVMLAVSAVAAILISWARSGSGKSTMSSLFDTVIGWVTSAAGRVAG
jgi:hypothetical protein